MKNSSAESIEENPADKEAWGESDRQSFEAPAEIYRGKPGKLRFLQYVNQASRPYWEARKDAGAVLL